MNNYDIINLIGEGAYGIVLKAKCKSTGQYFAIKKFKQTDDDDLIKRTTVRQLKVLKSLKHKNIIQLQQAFKKKGLVHLVFQYFDHNLLEVLDKNSSGLPNLLIASYIYQVLEGLQYMHSHNYVHRDIKPQNLLVNNQGIVKICDMGFAQYLSDKMTDYVATRWYRPPELLLGAKYGTPIDIWAVGCIIAQLSDTQPLFPGSDEIDQLTQIITKLGQLPNSLKTSFSTHPIYKGLSLPQIPKQQQIFSQYQHKLTQKGVDLLKKMLNLDPFKRITASQALSHPYFDIIRQRKSCIQKIKQNKNGISELPIKLIQSQTTRNTKTWQGIKQKSLQKSLILQQKILNTYQKYVNKKQAKPKTQSKSQNPRLFLQIQNNINNIYHKKQYHIKNTHSYFNKYNHQKSIQKINHFISPTTHLNTKPIHHQNKKYQQICLINI